MQSHKKLFIAIWIFSLTLLMAGGDLYQSPSGQNVSVLYPDESLAALYNKNKCMNGLYAKKIILWDQPSSFSEARKVGEIDPGTVTNVLEKYEDYYKIINPLNDSHKSCSDHVEASNKYLRQMNYYMETGDRDNGGLYTAAKKAQRAAIGVIQLCPFSIDLIADYACSLPFYSKVMQDEVNKY